MRQIKIVKFLELFLILRIEQRSKKVIIDVLDIFQTRMEATKKKRLYDFIGQCTTEKLKEIIREREYDHS